MVTTIFLLRYVLTADYHKEDVFAIKFYCKKDKTSDFKYSKIINKGDLGNILMTCASVVPLLLKEHPTASFGFGAARSVDGNNRTVEPYQTTQRFKVYSYIAQRKFGQITFAHYEYPEISCYLLVNKNCESVAINEKQITEMFRGTYIVLQDVLS